MITDAIASVVLYMVEHSIGMMLLLLPEPPTWAQDGFNGLGLVWGKLALMDAWIPISLAVTVASAIFTMYAVILTIGTVKLVLSYLTLGGGAT